MADDEKKLDLYLLRAGAEANFDGATRELCLATDSLLLMINVGSGAAAKIPTSRTTGDFTWQSTLTFKNMKIGTGSAIDDATVGATTRSTVGATTLLLDASDEEGVNESLTFSTSDVEHTHPGLANTNVYGYMARAHASEGGLNITGATETNLGLMLEGIADLNSLSADQDNTGRAIVELVGTASDSGDLANMSGTQNIFGVMKRSSAGAIVPLLLVAADGSVASGGTISNSVLDDYDDVRLLEGLRAIISPEEETKTLFADSIDYSKDVLVNNGIISINEDGSLGMFNLHRAVILIMDAIRQVAGRGLVPQT